MQIYSFARILKASIFKDSVIYVLGEMIAKAVPFLLLPYLTRMLGTTGFGDLSYYLSIISFILIGISLSQNGALTRYYYVYGKHGLGNILLAGGLYSFTILVIGLVFCTVLHQELLAYCFIASFFQSLVQNQLSLRQCQRRPLSYFSIQMSLALGNVILTILLFHFLAGDKVAERLMAIILSYFITFVAALISARTQFNLRFSWQLHRLKLAMTYIVTLGLPLLLHAISYTVKGQLDRVIIHQRFNAHELGIYAAGVQVASSITIIIMALNTAGVPYLYENLKSGRVTLAHLHKLFWLSLLVPPTLTVIAWGIPEWIYAWGLGVAFGSSRFYTLFFILAFSLAIPYLILVNYLFYYAKNALISISSVLTTAIYLVVLWWCSGVSLSLVPLATVISNIVILPILYYFTLKVKPA